LPNETLLRDAPQREDDHPGTTIVRGIAPLKFGKAKIVQN